MADTWAAAVLSAGTVLLAGRRTWERQRRRTQHARVAARRLHGQAQADLARLAGRLPAANGPALDARDPSRLDAPGSLLGPDLIGDFYRVVVAELQVWAEQTAQDLERLRGRRLSARRRALHQLRAEIRALCTEIEEREALWQGAPAGAGSEGRAVAAAAVAGAGASRGVGAAISVP